MTDELAVCPCGKIPKRLYVKESGPSCSWAMVSGSCCGDWHIEFRTYYEPLDSEKIMRLAREAWNAAPRRKK